MQICIYAKTKHICMNHANMHLYVFKYNHITMMKAICSPEYLLNVHEDLRRKTWFPVAWMPIYDTEMLPGK